ncbi:MAG: cell division protein FtsL [Persicimonas sp.]
MKDWLSKASKDGLQLLKVLAIVSIPVALLLFHVWTQFRITQLGYEVAEETTEHRGLIEEQRKLSIEATFQGRSERVLSVARERFGLQPLQPEQVVEIDMLADEQPAAEQAALQLRPQ